MQNTERSKVETTFDSIQPEKISIMLQDTIEKIEALAGEKLNLAIPAWKVTKYIPEWLGDLYSVSKQTIFFRVNKLTDDQLNYILLHETAHYVQNSINKNLAGINFPSYEKKRFMEGFCALNSVF
jgi:5'(3')-deoxyribonucleotidase